MPTEIFLSKENTTETQTVKADEKLDTDVVVEEIKPENAAYYREDLKLLFFAYNKFLAAPARWDNVTEKYVPMHPDVEMREDVGVFYAISEDMNFIASVYDDINDVPRV